MAAVSSYLPFFPSLMSCPVASILSLIVVWGASDGDGRDLRDEDEENDDNGENVGEEEDTYLSNGVEEEDDDSDFGENILNGLEDSAVVEDCSWSVSTVRSRNPNPNLLLLLFSRVARIEFVLCKLCWALGGALSKNLLLKDKKNRFYIVSALAGTKAPEEALQEVLQVPLGCVSPFAVINESARYTFFSLLSHEISYAQ
uniref:YbaK/aminoacyl-tRNA synthetase-associated domain-containing protein n=1 Tax=Ananas comosus var. bracteatus TaxID=296719 RepID=A0A6V7NYV4_ANACO|nr:unnamed protein product [Ananas comosus var. bracteatus]